MCFIIFLQILLTIFTYLSRASSTYAKPVFLCSFFFSFFSHSCDNTAPGLKIGLDLVDTSKYWITLWLVNARIGLNILSDMIFTFILSAWHFPLSATRRQNFIESTQWAPFRSHDQPSKTALLQTTPTPSPQLKTTTTRCSPAASCPLCFLCCTRTGCKQLLSTAGLELSHDKV